MKIGDVKHVIEITSDKAGPCVVCQRPPLQLEPGSLVSVAERVNHYIEAHGYRLLHIGQQSSWDRNGQQWQSTVAMLGGADVARGRSELAEDIAALRDGFRKPE